MKYIVVQNNQSLWDVSVQEYGSYDAVKQLIIDNPTVCNFHDGLVPGTKLKINEELIINKTIVDFLASKGLKPCTAVDVPANGNWILLTGNWRDIGIWDDLETWNDGSAPPYYGGGLIVSTE